MNEYAKMLDFDEFMLEHRGKTSGQFLREVKAPHLLVACMPNKTDDQGTRFDTRTDEFNVSDTTSFPIGKGLLVPSEKPLGVFPVRKRLGVANAFDTMITIGRATNNDVVLDDPHVSKFHAYFRRAGSQWTLYDAGSKNGTAVEGVHLPARQSSVLATGSRIVLASAWEFLFIEPAELYARLQQARG